MSKHATFSSAFRARMLSSRQEEGGERPLGIIRVRVAMFNVPDTEVAVGNESRQVIDPGSFRAWIDDSDFEQDPVQFYRDHGNAHVTGYVDSALQLGWADNFAESAEGLETDLHYFLDTPEGEIAYRKAQAKPELIQFSFRWPPTEKVEKGDDGFDHVKQFERIDEVSQVGFGAQQETGILAGSLRMARAAIGAHSTGTSTGSWDGPANEARLSTDAGAGTYRRAFAWVDPDGDTDTKAAYKFIHHEVGAGGNVGAANVTACRTGIGVLNGGRGGTTIPNEDRQGVYNHLAGHLRDADTEPPELRLPGDEPDAEEVEARASKSQLHRHLEKAHGMSGDGTVEELTAKHSKAHDDKRFADGMGHGGRENLVTSREENVDGVLAQLKEMLDEDPEIAQAIREIIPEPKPEKSKQLAESRAAAADWYASEMSLFPATKQLSSDAT